MCRQFLKYVCALHWSRRTACRRAMSVIRASTLKNDFFRVQVHQLIILHLPLLGWTAVYQSNIASQSGMEQSRVCCIWRGDLKIVVRSVWKHAATDAASLTGQLSTKRAWLSTNGQYPSYRPGLSKALQSPIQYCDRVVQGLLHCMGISVL